MFIHLLLLAISVSIDSLGIGITYGVKNTKLSPISKLILLIISIGITTFSIYIGDLFFTIFPPLFTKLLGCLLLVFMGIWILFQKEKPEDPFIHAPYACEPTMHEFFFRSLGLTIQIIRNPIFSDFDQSKQIDAKEALYLGLALSIDSLCVGIGSSILGFNTLLFPILVAIFQLFFLSFGQWIGKQIHQVSFLPNSIWNKISGFLLIFIGISRFFLS